MKHLSKQERLLLLNQETGIVKWSDLQIHFARGVLIHVNHNLDLVTVADTFVVDHKDTINAWKKKKWVQLTPPDLAIHWEKDQITLWAIVVAPWVLVQEQQTSDLPPVKT